MCERVVQWYKLRCELRCELLVGQVQIPLKLFRVKKGGKCQSKIICTPASSRNEWCRYAGFRLNHQLDRFNSHWRLLHSFWVKTNGKKCFKPIIYMPCRSMNKWSQWGMLWSELSVGLVQILLKSVPNIFLCIYLFYLFICLFGFAFTKYINRKPQNIQNTKKQGNKFDQGPKGAQRTPCWIAISICVIW